MKIARRHGKSSHAVLIAIRLTSSSSIYGHIDFLGKGATSLLEDVCGLFCAYIDMLTLVTVHRHNLPLVFKRSFPTYTFSSSQTCGLTIHKPLSGCRRCLIIVSRIASFPNLLCCVVILPVALSRKGMPAMCNDTKVNIITYTYIYACLIRVFFADNFDALADLIASYPIITRTTHFVLVPGPLDITRNSILPRRPLLSSFVSRLKAKVPKVYFATNPCRIKFCGQEIVIFREDTMAKMLRNTIRVKQEAEGEDLRRYVSRTSDTDAPPVDYSTPLVAGIVYSRSKPPDAFDTEHTTNVVRL